MLLVVLPVLAVGLAAGGRRRRRSVTAASEEKEREAEEDGSHGAAIYSKGRDETIGDTCDALFVSRCVVFVACVAALAFACASPAPAHVAPPPPRVATIASVAPVDTSAADAAKIAADAAVTKLAERLQAVERACRDRWLGAEAVCHPGELDDLALAYRAYYPPETDPRRNESRIDALPRIAGPDISHAQLFARLDQACEERCDLSRRGSIADLRGAAVAACVASVSPKAGHAACAALAKHVPANNPPESARTAPSDCEAACEGQKRDARATEERERRRPRTPAQSHACFRECMTKCTGGRIVPNADGKYTRDPDDWCGTCDFTCDVTCAVKRP